jgi:hypothetical protein
MARKKEISADTLLALMDYVMNTPEIPFVEFPFELDAPDLDLAAIPSPISAILKMKPAPEERMLPISGTHSICIRVPARVIRAYKLKAIAKGCCYQTLMNRALAAASKD